MLDQIYGEIPTGDVVFAACDSEYFMEHGPAFVYSANKINKSVHIHVVNPTPEVYSLAAIMASTTHVMVTYTFHVSDLSHLTEEGRRVYYACLRFHVMPILLQYVSVMCVDIDSVFMNPFSFPEEVAGYFPREPLSGTTGWEAEGTRCAAGAVFFKKEDGFSFALDVSLKISRLPAQWFVDQIALSEVFRKIETTSIPVKRFSSTLLDWEFEENTTIWTGKGQRKYENMTYLGEKNRYRDVFEFIKMNYSFVILKPRLDCPFKITGLFRSGPIPEIRNHWTNFVSALKEEISIDTGGNGTVLEIEAPRWMFNNTIGKYFNPDTFLYVPHTQLAQFGSSIKNVKFYMQTVFPWIFTVDDIGWSGSLGSLHLFEGTKEETPITDQYFNTLRNYSRAGGSKFAQPPRSSNYLPDEYIFVPLQLPHDETIMYHSDVKVPEFVKLLCEWAEYRQIHIVFKGHPVNLASMEPLKDIIRKYNYAVYVDDMPIQQLIGDSVAVYTINSGVGQEAMLYGKPIVAFGRAEYSSAVIGGQLHSLDAAIHHVHTSDPSSRQQAYQAWYTTYIERICFDTTGLWPRNY